MNTEVNAKLTLDNLDQHRVESRQGSWKAIAMKICQRIERKLWAWGLVSSKCLRSRALELWKRPFIKLGYKLLSLQVDIYAKEKLTH